MTREYIIKVDEDKKDIMGDCPLVEKPKELVRCKDCRKRGTIMCHLWFNSPIPKDNWYCADGERKDGDGEC